ncbi:PAS domain S-box protein [Methylotetracoccus oryzae]|uniref:PAS domain S-box protein n=1 Tax=Methylotetracoccus oryzae TaxID=1919059 RepID=UPI0013A54475|nr:PAS domain S-box protein [Methylotetracoccus oryzae]
MAGIDDLTLENIMSRRIVTAAPDCQLGAAAAQMVDRRVSSLVIMEGGHVAGILTERDLVRLVHQRTPPETALASVMTHPVIAAPHDLDFRSGYALLRQHRVRHLLVTAADGEPVGIATATDFRTHLGLEVFRKIDDLQSVQDPVAAELSPAATLADAVQMMMSTGSDYVLVVEQHVLLGILTERDLSGLLAGEADPRTLRVDQVMTTPVHCLSPAASVADAAAAMARLRVRHMPVTDARQVVQGVVSQARLLEKIGVEWLDHDHRERLDLRADNARLQDRLSLTLEAAAVGIWEYDHAADRVSWSRGCCDLLGYREDQAPTRFKDWLELVHPDDHPDLLARIEAAQGPDNPLYKAEYRLRKACGTWCWIHARGRVMHRSSDGSPLLTAGTMADVSARKHTEITLRAQHQLAQALALEADRPALWAALLESALMLPDIDCGVLYRIDGGNGTLLAESRLAGTIRDRDVETSAMSMLVEAVAQNRPLTHRLAPDPQDDDSCRFAPGVMEAEALRSITALPIRIDGEAATCLCLGSRHCRELPAETISALQTLVPPITLALLRIRAKEDAQHQRKNIEGLFRAMSDFLFVTDCDGRIVHYNEPVATRLAPDTGWLGLPIWQIHPPDVQDEARRVLRDIAAGHRTTCSLPLVARDGARILVDTRVVHGEWNGQPALLGLARDVTELMGQRDAISRSDALLRTTLDSTADGLLVCGVDGEVLLMNSRFRELWQMPDALCAARSNGPLLQHASKQLADPAAFLAGVQQLYRCDDEQTDHLAFKDGRVYERFTRPLRLGGQAARLWSFRDMTERARARRAVEYERARLKSLIRTIPDLVWLKDPDGVYLACNPSFEKLYGAPEADIVGKTDYDFVDRETADFFRANDREAFTQRTGRVNEERLTFADSGYRGIFETIKTPMFDSDGQLIGVLGVARDVTQRREIESRLRDSEQALREAQAIALVGSWTLDLRRDEMRCSNETYRILEVPYDPELRRESFLSRIHPDDLSSVRKAWDNVWSGRSFDIEHRIVVRDGIRWVRERAEVRLDEHGAPIFAVGTVQDVTERRNAEEQLRKLWLAVEQSPNSIVITDTEARIEYVNQAFVDSTGYSREDALGQNPRLLDSGQTPKSTHRELWAALTRGETWEGEFINRRRDGSLYTESARISPVRQPSGQITHYLAVKEDITERKQASAELERYRHHLEELVAERTAELAASKDAAEAASRAKSAFLANMSHEIRTPLNAIVGLTYLLQRRIEAPEAQRQLGKVTEAADHLLTLINDILDISKIEAGKLTLNQTEFELTSLLERITALFWEKAAERTLEVVYDIDPELTGHFVGDPVRLGQVLLNLVGNAVKFTESGYVLVRMQRQAENGDTLWLRCEVRDTGIGIHPDDQRRLFAAFEQADSSTTRRYGGTGLGLAISRRLVRLMGGEIGVTSALARGSTFWFTTRLIRLGEHSGDAREALRKRLSGKRALVVDDLPAVRTALAGLLGDLGITVDTTASSSQALASLATAHRARTPYDLVIVDRQLLEPIALNAAWSLVDECGEAVTRLISLGRGDVPDPPAAAVAADQPWVYLAKPVTPAALYDALRRAQEQANGSAKGSEDARADTAAPAPDYTALALLVVEDNAINREVVTALLDELGIHPDIAHHGAEAVEMASGRAYDLILMDVQMPVMDGLAATRAIRRLPDGASVPIIAMTANAFDEDRALCLAAGMDGMLVKPVDPGALFTAITEYLTVPAAGSAPPQAPPSAGDGGAAAPFIRAVPIDPELGLRYTGGDVPRYHRALRRFAATHDRDLMRLRSLLEGGDWQQAEHLVHSLKGVAALLGATELQGSAADLEAALRANATGTALDAPLAALETAHHTLLEILPELLSDSGDQPKASIAERNLRRNELLRLEALLAEDDASVTQLYTTCAPGLRSAFGVRADQLARLLDNFDYPLALTLVHELLAEFRSSDENDA